MIEELDFSKVSNSHIKLLEFDVVVAAAKGDRECIDKVIEHYKPYLRELATKELFDKFGNEYKYMDETFRCQLENKLIKSVLKFKVQP